MSRSDIPAGLRLCRASRWNQTERDWEYFLAAAPDGARVAVENGAVVGTVAMLPYGPFAWISMVLVDPAARGRGVGTMLLHEGLHLVPEGVTARLDATPAGEVIYRRLGFVPEYGLARLVVDALPVRPAPHSGVCRLDRDHWPALLDVDMRAFGASRAGLLQRLADDAPEYSWIAEWKGRRGYLFGRHGHVREHLGPLVAEDVDTARVLLDAWSAANHGRPACIDVPDDQRAWRAHLAQLGFGIERPFLRLYRGSLTAPGQPRLVYAVAGPELG
jgi:ribosomal protein S18 acetylase RimI-like enzyme